MELVYGTGILLCCTIKSTSSSSIYIVIVGGVNYSNSYST